MGPGTMFLLLIGLGTVFPLPIRKALYLVMNSQHSTARHTPALEYRAGMTRWSLRGHVPGNGTQG